MSWTQTITLEPLQVVLRKPEEYRHLVVRLKADNSVQDDVSALVNELASLKIFAPSEEQKLQGWQKNVPLRLFCSKNKQITPPTKNGHAPPPTKSRKSS